MVLFLVFLVKVDGARGIVFHELVKVVGARGIVFHEFLLNTLEIFYRDCCVRGIVLTTILLFLVKQHFLKCRRGRGRRGRRKKRGGCYTGVVAVGKRAGHTRASTRWRRRGDGPRAL